jgi:ribosome-binding protein aMBF1 (putative translation factor)
MFPPTFGGNNATNGLRLVARGVTRQGYPEPSCLTTMPREQLRMARAALDWSADELAAKAGVAISTIRRFESGKGALYETVEKLRRTLEAGGVEFIPENGGGPGVRLKKIKEA